jgi:initiation factor 1A
MVKNAGGNKSKRQGRKFVNAPIQKSIRYATEDGELYAAVVKLMGGSHCEVMCIDGKTRMCVIRNKFKGRSKRDNLLTRGVWILVGIRDWEVRSGDKLEKCDLLEVYSSSDKDKLKQDTSSNFTAILGIGDDDRNDNDDYFEFVDDTTSTYQEAIENQLKVNYSSVIEEQEEEIDIDDI